MARGRPHRCACAAGLLAVAAVAFGAAEAWRRRTEPGLAGLGLGFEAAPPPDPAGASPSSALGAAANGSAASGSAAANGSSANGSCPAAVAPQPQEALFKESLLCTKSPVSELMMVPEPVLGNHLYKDEKWLGKKGMQKHGCREFDTDAGRGSFSAVLDNATFPWRKSIRGPGPASPLHGTAFAFRKIWQHQHPKNCNTAKFYVLRHFPAGIGSSLHVLSASLAVAMTHGRVLVHYEDPSFMWYDRKYCRGVRSWECWFLPMTSCKPLPDADVKPIDYKGVLRPQRAFAHVPRIFRDTLSACSHLKPQRHYAWFRSVSLAYFVRFNGRTREQLDGLRARTLKVVRREGSSLPEKLGQLPPGTVSVHVRHSDKGREMELLDFPEYHAKAVRLAAGDQCVPVIDAWCSEARSTFAYEPGHFGNRALFVSTEDPRVIKQAVELSRKQGRDAWDVVYTDEYRGNLSPRGQVKRKGVKQQTLESFLILELALEADAWVCTLQSNWCRLIDELRMTVAGKAALPYINLPSGTHEVKPV